jgi:hypothetical protein
MFEYNYSDLFLQIDFSSVMSTNTKQAGVKAMGGGGCLV